jgi:hypothetical protein
MSSKDPEAQEEQPPPPPPSQADDRVIKDVLRLEVMGDVSLDWSQLMEDIPLDRVALDDSGPHEGSEDRGAPEADDPEATDRGAR